MNSHFKDVFFALVLNCFLVFAAHGQTTAFTYQGKLSEGANNAPTGAYDMRFRLYNTATVGTGTQTGGDLIFSAATSSAVNVSNGVFTVRLDFGSSPFASGADRYLEIAVKHAGDASYTILADRQQIAAAPFSIRTLSASAADTLSANCVGCVTNAQINSIDGAKVTGSVANATNAANATSANTATTAGNVTGVVQIANGGTGSATKNFVDLTTNQTIAGAKTFSGNLRTNNLIRIGSETGTTDNPHIDDGTVYSGLVVRRINSLSTLAGNVAARTNFLRLERDGSNGGWRIANDALPAFESQTVHCLGITGSSAVFTARVVLAAGATAGTNQLFTNAQGIEYMQCSFGNAFEGRHLTQVTLQRHQGDFYWIGTVTSTFNQ